MVAVSVVVPVYNGEKHIRGIADFLQAQDFDDFEVVFSIDVRSPDDSRLVVEQVCSERKGFSFVFQTDEEHLAGARNRGFDAARGEFVWFCDVDDAPSSHFISAMYALQQESGADMVVCSFLNVKPGGCVPDDDGRGWNHAVYDRAGALRLISTHGFPVSTWTKLFRRSLLEDNGIRFNDSRAEDIEHLYRVLNYVDKVCVTDRPLYAYRLTEGSICRTPENYDARGMSEIAAYLKADEIWKDSPDAAVILCHNALLRMRSSGHMTWKGFKAYHDSEQAMADYGTYFKWTPEGLLYRYFPRIYHIAIRFYIANVYKRNGSAGMKRLRK